MKEEIFECACPKCGEVYENYFDEDVMIIYDTYIRLDYNLCCEKCKTKFLYSEYFNLARTTMKTL